MLTVMMKLDLSANAIGLLKKYNKLLNYEKYKAPDVKRIYMYYYTKHKNR